MASLPADHPILFQDTLPQELVCPFCEQALRAPVRTSCGHDFCSECIQPQMTCAVCNQTVEMTSRNTEKHRLVQSLPVYCTFREAGCGWFGILKQLQAHGASCEHRVENCPTCGITVAGKDYESHMGKCQVLACEYCNALVKFSSFERHLQKCPKVLLSCSYLCGVVDIPREEMDRHRMICPNGGELCPFGELGCNFTGDKTEIRQHLAKEPMKHLVVMCDEMTAIKRYFDLATDNLEIVEKQHVEMCRRMRICERIYGPQLIWKIDDVQTKTNEAKSGARPVIFSPAFVSGRHGYKLIASANLFGDGPSRGEYMSVYVALIRGEFDPVLEWPFKMTIRFTLLNQNPTVNERINVTFSVDSRRLAERATHFLGQPIGGRNQAFGAQRFCSLERLQEYIKDDTLFLQVDLEEPTDAMMMRPSFKEAILFDEEMDGGCSYLLG